jgi:hypothetical protein
MAGTPTCGRRLGRYGSDPAVLSFNYVVFFNAEVMTELAAMLEFESETLHPIFREGSHIR